MTKAINTALYGVISEIWGAYQSNGGNLEFQDQRYGWLNDMMDELLVGYFGQSPDGDHQEECAEQIANGTTKPFTDKEAYDYMLSWLNNTDLFLVEQPKTKAYTIKEVNVDADHTDCYVVLDPNGYDVCGEWMTKAEAQALCDEYNSSAPCMSDLNADGDIDFNQF